MLMKLLQSSTLASGSEIKVEKECVPVVGDLSHAFAMRLIQSLIVKLLPGS